MSGYGLSFLFSKVFFLRELFDENLASSFFSAEFFAPPVISAITSPGEGVSFSLNLNWSISIFFFGPSYGFLFDEFGLTKLQLIVWVYVVEFGCSNHWIVPSWSLFVPTGFFRKKLLIFTLGGASLTGGFRFRFLEICTGTVDFNSTFDASLEPYLTSS